MPVRRRSKFLLLVLLCCLLSKAGAQETASLSGTISITPDLQAGSTVTVAVSTDYFRNNTVQFFPFAAQGAILPYIVTLPAPATYYVIAFAGVPEDGPLPGAPIGVYDNYAPVYIASGAAVSNINFPIAPDIQPPSAAITSIVEGSTIAELSAYPVLYN